MTNLVVAGSFLCALGFVLEQNLNRLSVLTTLLEDANLSKPTQHKPEEEAKKHQQ